MNDATRRALAPLIDLLEQPLARYLLVALLLLAVLGLLSSWLRRAPEFRVRARPLVTANEAEFLHRLEQAVPEFRVMAQVSMSALLEPDLRLGTPEPGRYLSVRGRFAQKVVDYVILDDDLRVVALIELDDRTHDASRDADRDAITGSAGYMTLRYESRNKPEPTQLRQDILDTRKETRSRLPAVVSDPSR